MVKAEPGANSDDPTRVVYAQVNKKKQKLVRLTGSAAAGEHYYIYVYLVSLQKTTYVTLPEHPPTDIPIEKTPLVRLCRGLILSLLIHRYCRANQHSSVDSCDRIQPTAST